MLQTGLQVDKYVVEALLGEGGMASVYRVRHQALGSAHALKLLKVDSAEIRQRLQGEGRIQASLRHPNIVAVTDVLVVGN
jgi:serine/threonine-protein kinase